jgi:hypothetical protein
MRTPRTTGGTADRHRALRPVAEARRWRRAAGALAGLAVAAVLAACAPPADTRAAPEAVLYVANARDGTVSRIDLPGGRPAGAAIPVGAAPAQLVASPGGHLLVVPTTADRGAAPALVTRGGGGPRGPGAWRTRPLPLEPGARHVLLAGDGGDLALLAYELTDSTGDPAAARCRLVLVDLGTGDVAPPRTVCRGPESVVGLALDAPPGGNPADAVAYLAVWRAPPPGGPDGCDPPPGGRIAAVLARTGAPIAATALAGVPDRLVLAPAGDAGRRLYAVEAAPLPSTGLPDACPSMTHGKYVVNAGGWALLGLAPDTLAVERRLPLPLWPYALAVAPDGDHAYALAPMTAVFHLDLAGGAVRPFAALADAPLGIAVTADRVYVADPRADAVRALDRRTGREVRVVPEPVKGGETRSARDD